MKKSTVIGLAIGALTSALSVVAGVALYKKATRELGDDACECNFTSSDGDNFVTVSYGSSKNVKGLAVIKVKASKKSKEDECKLTIIAKKNSELLSGEWIDDENFRLLVGNGVRKQCCDVTFDGEEICARYYIQKC